jgi:hypothetical protein
MQLHRASKVREPNLVSQRQGVIKDVIDIYNPSTTRINKEEQRERYLAFVPRPESKQGTYWQKDPARALIIRFIVDNSSR